MSSDSNGGISPLDKQAEKRVTRAVETARKACTEPELQELYRKRFHRAMDALESREEGEAVYDRCRREGWYLYAAEALKHGV